MQRKPAANAPSPIYILSNQEPSGSCDNISKLARLPLYPLERVFSPSCARSFFSTVEATLNAAHVCPWHLFAFIVPVRIPRGSRYSRGVPPPRNEIFSRALFILYRVQLLNFVSNRWNEYLGKGYTEIPDIHSPSLSTCEWAWLKFNSYFCALKMGGIE